MHRIDGWPIEGNDFGVMEPGLHRVYKRGYMAYSIAFMERSDENFHELRKRVKYLWYQIRILKQLWHVPLKGMASEIHRLADYLGDEHDLAVLDANIDNTYIDFKDDRSRHLLQKFIREQRFRLQERANPLAIRIFHHPPGAYVNQFRTYYRGMQEEMRKEYAPINT